MPVHCCLQCTEKGTNTNWPESVNEWSIWSDAQNKRCLVCWAVHNLLSWLIVRWWSSIMSRWPTFPRNAALLLMTHQCWERNSVMCFCPDSLMSAPPPLRAFYLDQSNMPASSAPKAALIDKVRIALQRVDDITGDVNTSLCAAKLLISLNIKTQHVFLLNLHFCKTKDLDLLFWVKK